jgi:hypothetical protein
MNYDPAKDPAVSEIAYMMKEYRDLTPEDRKQLKELFDYLKWRAKERKRERGEPE